MKGKEDRIIGYEEAKNEFYNMFASQERKIRTLNIQLIVALIVIIISILFNWNLTTKSKLIPYVIEVDQTGNAKAINPAYQTNYVPMEAQKKYFLNRLLLNMRTITRDPVVNGRNYQDNLFFLNEPTQNKYQELITSESKNENLTAMLKDGVVREVEVISFNKRAGIKNLYDLHWTENYYNASGNLIMKQNMISQFTIEQQKPSTIEQMDKNPLGIIVTDFTITKQNN